MLPTTLGKGKAVHFLQEQRGLPYVQVVAGDSGNYREMFEIHFEGMVPANALEELKLVARQPGSITILIQRRAVCWMGYGILVL